MRNATLALLLALSAGCGTLIPTEKTTAATNKAASEISTRQTVDTVRETQNAPPPSIKIKVYQPAK